MPNTDECALIQDCFSAHSSWSHLYIPLLLCLICYVCEQEYAETDNVTNVLILRIEQSKLSKMLYYLMNTLLFIYFFILFY